MILATQTILVIIGHIDLHYLVHQQLLTLSIHTLALSLEIFLN
jgi:hypothetical protein